MAKIKIIFDENLDGCTRPATNDEVETLDILDAMKNCVLGNPVNERCKCSSNNHDVISGLHKLVDRATH